MTRSVDFNNTVRNGVRSPQPDLVVHAHRAPDVSAPRVGLIVAKSVGGAVDRHRVARRLRHAVRALIAELNPTDRVVIRALPSSRDADSARLRDELQAAFRRVHVLMERQR